MAGRRIDDHESWVGRASKGSVFPEGVKVKSYPSADGNEEAGSLDYPDTTEMIKRDQEKGISKVKSHPLRPGYRN